jgi:hypothetical protein
MHLLLSSFLKKKLYNQPTGIATVPLAPFLLLVTVAVKITKIPRE